MYVIYLKGTHVLGHFYYGNEGRDKFSLCQQGQHPTPTLTQMRWMPCKRLIPYHRRDQKGGKTKTIMVAILSLTLSSGQWHL